MIEIKNKTTIITDYDSATRMMDFCKDNDQKIKKDFFDWYLKEDTFFVKKGRLAVENIVKSRSMIILFDFDDPDEPKFEIYASNLKDYLAIFSFMRQDNLKMSQVDVNIKKLSHYRFRKSGMMMAHKDIEKRMLKLKNSISMIGSHRSPVYQKPHKNQLQDSIKSLQEHIDKETLSVAVYFVYACMYYVSRQKAEKLPAIEEDEKVITETIKSVYKYTGYVDLRKSKVYHARIKRGPDEPIREYNRHISSWIVRGHYRKVNEKLIWIDSHLKGSGEVENRVYSTMDKKDLELPEKVFEVERTVQTTTGQVSKTIKKKTLINMYIFWTRLMSFFSKKEA